MKVNIFVSNNIEPDNLNEKEGVALILTIKNEACIFTKFEQLNFSLLKVFQL